MAVNVHKSFEKGGQKLINLLDYCVRSMEIAPVFLFLVQEYRRAPTAAKAVALFEVFCQANAPAKLDVAAATPPINPQIQTALYPFLASQENGLGPEGTRLGRSQPVRMPPKYLFDFIAEAVQRNSGSFRRVCLHYRPSKSPLENLAGGKMTAAKRHFVEKIWEPTLRPRLISAGFWRISSIG